MTHADLYLDASRLALAFAFALYALGIIVFSCGMVFASDKLDRDDAARMALWTFTVATFVSLIGVIALLGSFISA